jgi:hypothetical protein
MKFPISKTFHAVSIYFAGSQVHFRTHNKSSPDGSGAAALIDHSLHAADAGTHRLLLRKPEMAYLARM